MAMGYLRSKAEASRICKNCGNVTMPDSVFCRNCGIALHPQGAGETSEPAFSETKRVPLGERLRALKSQLATVDRDAVMNEGLPSSPSSPTSRVLANLRANSPSFKEHHGGTDLHEGHSTMSLEPAQPRFNPREVDRKVTSMEQRVTQMVEGESARLKLLADQVKRLDEGLSAVRVAREIHDERRKKELKVVESSLLVDLEKSTSARQEMESRFQDASEQVFATCREELLKEQSRRETVHDEYAKEISEEVQRLSVLLEEQRSARMEYGERIVGVLEAEFQKVHDSIVAEQKLRFEAESTMLRMVEDVCGRLGGEIRQERSARENVQNKLLSLLEETCSRIETSFSRTAEPRGQLMF
eukprot:TRINITY_DN108673_c0_g1_i1.p1 TRINITY_DN108673_c0_g1~~TRINITY_DN108673_c0_g1_i1.p1  ORF type:complete len:370 (-),score=78.62 TRINITY_DN108673_c0_g1_i1:34-1104(-)